MNHMGDRSGYFRLIANSCALICLLLSNSSTFAQLQITEVMASPLNPDAWQWIEVRNTSGSDFNLNGSYLDSIGEPAEPNGTPANITSGSSPGGTMVPVGGVAILFNADLAGIDPNQGDTLFRQAWAQGDPNTHTAIAVNNFPAFSSSASSIGIWPDYGSYQADLISGNTEVGSFDNATVGLDFRQQFPTPAAGNSMAWNGLGDFQNGANWNASVAGSSGAVTSTAAPPPGPPLNSTLDVGNPGYLPDGYQGITELLITEMMIDPHSSEPAWEWIEVYNGTGADLDFSDVASEYYFDDDDGGDLNQPNITSGMLKHEQIGVLYNADLITMQNMIDAWDPNGRGAADPNGLGPVFIPVENFPSLDNNEDEIGIWGSTNHYETDSQGLGRDFNQAITSVAYGGASWTTIDINGPSLYLNNLGGLPDFGGNWSESTPGALLDPNSFFASAVIEGELVHAGGDVGSPGLVDFDDADFDENGIVDGLDFLIWQANVGVGTTFSQGDSNGDGQVDSADLFVWQTQYGSAPPLQTLVAVVPEPMSLTLCVSFILLASGRVRSIAYLPS